ncbi:hypothetical protein Q8A67_008610 [Cirrhinus molitorella]|uniref:AIG1-type G domain-containing protein n=1 Tax=Cirrhinus molitorella TaxID=172907 RepID=A0AA88PYK2_9TELE|nr:hypothetical protein Q8A67_008610 [Cirrhinus molitorella]
MPRRSHKPATPSSSRERPAPGKELAGSLQAVDITCVMRDAECLPPTSVTPTPAIVAMPCQTPVYEGAVCFPLPRLSTCLSREGVQVADQINSLIIMDQGTDDDVMDTSPESYGDSGDVMDISSVSYRNPNDVNPPVAHQNTDDAMDTPHETDQEAAPAPPAAHQNPDTMMDSPPLTNSENYTENINKENYDPFVTDLTTKVEFQMQPTSVPLLSLQDSVKPVEEGSNPKPDGNANIVADVSSGLNDSSHNTDRGNPDLTIAVFGSYDAVEFGCDNILLGDKQLCHKNAEFPMIIQERKLSEHCFSVINMIGSHETDSKPLDHVIGQLMNENEIHAFIFVMRLGQLTDADKMGIEWLQRIFGDRVLSFVIILFTYEKEEECDTIIDDLKNNSVLEQLLKKCEGRYHTCSKIMNSQSEMSEMMDRIKRLFTDNYQRCYTREMYSSLRDPQNSEYQSGAETVSIGETNAQTLGSLVQTDKGDKQKLKGE